MVIQGPVATSTVRILVAACQCQAALPSPDLT